MIRILLICTNADEAGAPRHVESLVEGLGSSFHFALIFGEEGPVSVRLRNRGYDVYVVSQMRTAISPLNDLIALSKIYSLVKKTNPNIIHCHSTKAGMLGRLVSVLTRKRWIYTVHGWGWRGLSNSKKWAVIFIEKALSFLSNGSYVFVAKEVMNEGVRVLGLRDARGVLIYNGVPDLSINKKAVDNHLTILMPARVSTAKDHKSLVIAFERLNDPIYKLTLCGGGTDSEDFIQSIRDIAPRTFQDISFLGQHSDMHNLYSGADIVVLISRFEALPLSIIEAMSCALPVIATSIGGVPELISSGINGYLVRPGNVDDIVGALIRYKNEQQRVDHGRQARITYDKYFRVESMLLATARVYQAVQ